MKNKQKTRNLTILMIIVIIGLVAGILLKGGPILGIIGSSDGPTKIITGDKEKEKADLAAKEQREKLTKEVMAAKDRGILILVNKQHSVDENYKPADLTPVKYYAKDRTEASRYMRKEAAEQFHKLVEVANAEGHEIVMTTAYRSYGFQKQLYDNYVKTEGQESADKFSAKPGTSEHQTGLSVDVSSPSVEYSLSYEYGKTAEGKWLAENAHKFGFIIRFPVGKEDITGYNHEPWHIRYVGKAVAEEIYKKDITLEEFLEEEQ